MKNKRPKRDIALRMIGNSTVPKYDSIFDHKSWQMRLESKRAKVERQLTPTT